MKYCYLAPSLHDYVEQLEKGRFCVGFNFKKDKKKLKTAQLERDAFEKFPSYIESALYCILRNIWL